MDRIALFVRHGALVVHRIAGDIDDAAEHALPDRHRDRRPGIGDRHSADKSLGGRHCDGADDSLAQVLLDLERELLRPAGRAELHGERLIDGGHILHRELDVDHGADDLDDLADVHWEKAEKLKLTARTARRRFRGFPA